jgi:hypothetical protein
MKTSLIRLLCALIASASLAHAQSTVAGSVRNISLTEPREIADAAAVKAAISALVKDAASCNTSTSDPQACACGFENDLKKLKSAYDSAASRHPTWNEPNTAVAYVDRANGHSVVLNLPGVKRQLDACAKPAAPT